MSSLLVIYLGWCSNFVGSESGKKQSVKLLWSTAQFNIPLPPSHILSVYTVQCTFSFGKGGRSERRYSRGATAHKYCSFIHGGNSSQPGSKLQSTEWMYLQSIKSVKHNAAKSVNRSILKKSRHIGFGVFIVHSSMLGTILLIFLVWFSSSFLSNAQAPPPFSSWHCFTCLIFAISLLVVPVLRTPLLSVVIHGFYPKTGAWEGAETVLNT